MIVFSHTMMVKYNSCYKQQRDCILAWCYGKVQQLLLPTKIRMIVFSHGVMVDHNSCSICCANCAQCSVLEEDEKCISGCIYGCHGYSGCMMYLWLSWLQWARGGGGVYQWVYLWFSWLQCISECIYGCHGYSGCIYGCHGYRVLEEEKCISGCIYGCHGHSVLEETCISGYSLSMLGMVTVSV